MGKYGLAAILAVVYITGSIVAVRSVGEAHRMALLAATADPAPKRVDTPAPAIPPVMPVPIVVAANVPAPAPKMEAKPVEVANVPSPESIAKPPSPKKEEKSKSTEEDLFLNRPEMTKIWDLKTPKVEEIVQFGAAMHKIIVETTPPTQDAGYRRRVIEAAEPLLKLRTQKDNPIKFEVLEDNGWNAFSHTGDYIYISRGLLDAISIGDEETYILQFVIAHELYHLDNYHTLMALNDPEVVTLPGGTVAHYLLLILPHAFPDKAEYAADQWAHKAVLQLGYTPAEALGFLRRFVSYSKLPRNNFEDGHAAPNRDQNTFLYENHFRAHPAAWERLKALKALEDVKPAVPAAKPLK